MAQKFVVYKEEKEKEGAQFIGVTTRTGSNFIQKFTSFIKEGLSKTATSHKDGTVKLSDGKTTIESFQMEMFNSLEDLDLPK